MRSEIAKGVLSECRKGGKADIRTQYTIETDTESLYIHFEAGQVFPFPKHTSYNAALYEGDILEVMLTLGDRRHYLEIEINQYNAKYCVLIENRDGEGDIAITPIPCLFESKIYGNDKLWLCDAELSLRKLSELGFSLESAYYNVLRQDFRKDGRLELYAAFPTLSDTFHKSEAFGKLLNFFF